MISYYLIVSGNYGGIDNYNAIFVDIGEAINKILLCVL